MMDKSANCYEIIKEGHGGFNDMTISRTLAMMLNQMKIPTIEAGGVIKFRPKGASSFGGYIYKSGVVMIFNEHTTPFSKDKVSLRDALKELSHKSRYGYIPLYKQIERDRAIWLMEVGQKYEDVYGYDGIGDNNVEDDSPKKVKVLSKAIPDEEITSYLDIRFPFRNSIFQKFNEGETTLWEIFRLINGSVGNSPVLQKQTLYARREGEKLSLPVIYPNYHTFDCDGRTQKVPNRCVMLDFDLEKQGVDKIKGRRIRSHITCMEETVCVCDSFTSGNFWALVAIGDTASKYKDVANAVCEDVEKRLAAYAVQLDRSCCVLSQARFVVYDKNAVIKHPSRRFVERI